MKRIKRIFLGTFIIIFIFVALNCCASKKVLVEVKPASRDLIGISKSSPREAKGLRVAEFENLKNIYAAVGYSPGSLAFPALGYDTKLKKLVPVNLIRKKSWTTRPFYEFDALTIFASYRDALASSNIDLEKRIRKLENTINKIIRECCPKGITAYRRQY